MSFTQPIGHVSSAPLIDRGGGETGLCLITQHIAEEFYPIGLARDADAVHIHLDSRRNNSVLCFVGNLRNNDRRVLAGQPVRGGPLDPGANG